MNNKVMTALLFSLFICGSIISQESDISSEQTYSIWNGYEREDFVFNGAKAHIVFPKNALEGNPWVWRARFPDYHSDIDSLLLAEGFHIAYVNTNGCFGSPRAMNLWDEFFRFVTSKYQLNDQVVLHAHSRGGLFAYTWAKRHPQHITCIYADAIVCDINSWPAGFGEGEGSSKAWVTLKKEYNFASDDEARAYSNNPIDSLELLVNGGVPIMHTLGLSDPVVPVEENSLLLVDRYLRLGGTATVSSLDLGIQRDAEHHYTIPNKQPIIDFITYHTFK